jgi:hypothetical protein
MNPEPSVTPSASDSISSKEENLKLLQAALVLIERHRAEAQAAAATAASSLSDINTVATAAKVAGAQISDTQAVIAMKSSIYRPPRIMPIGFEQNSTRRSRSRRSMRMRQMGIRFVPKIPLTRQGNYWEPSRAQNPRAKSKLPPCRRHIRK